MTPAVRFNRGGDRALDKELVAILLNIGKSFLDNSVVVQEGLRDQRRDQLSEVIRDGIRDDRSKVGKEVSGGSIRKTFPFEAALV